MSQVLTVPYVALVLLEVGGPRIGGKLSNWMFVKSIPCFRCQDLINTSICTLSLMLIRIVMGEMMLSTVWSALL